MIEITCPSCGGHRILYKRFVLEESEVERFDLNGNPLKLGKSKHWTSVTLTPEETSHGDTYASFMCKDCHSYWDSPEALKEAGVLKAKRDRKSNAYYAELKKKEQEAGDDQSK